MILKTQINSISRQELLRLNKALKTACSEIIGKSNAKLKTTKLTSIRYLGRYIIPENTIIIYRGMTPTIEDYVRVFIHEWAHSCQTKIEKDYFVMNAKYGYYNNPFEIEARQCAKTYKSEVWKMTKDLLRK
jgi:hypothetical protein